MRMPSYKEYREVMNGLASSAVKEKQWRMKTVLEHQQARPNQSESRMWRASGGCETVDQYKLESYNMIWVREKDI